MSDDIHTDLYSYNPDKPQWNFLKSRQLLKECHRCRDITGRSNPVGPVKVSGSGRKYQRCQGEDGSYLHYNFFPTEAPPVEYTPGLPPPILPPVPFRGKYKGKQLCSQEGCTKQRGHKKCSTERCMPCCVQAAIDERLSGRDGINLCEHHQSWIIKKIEELEIPDVDDVPVSASQDSNANTSTFERSPVPDRVLPDSPQRLDFNDTDTGIASAAGVPPRLPSPFISPSRVTASTSTAIASTSTKGTRKPPRAMPVNLTFIAPSSEEQARLHTATQRANQEDLSARLREQMRVTYWPSKDRKLVSKISFDAGGKSAFAIDSHPTLLAILASFNANTVTIFDPSQCEWTFCAISMVWNFDGFNRILMRGMELDDDDCPDLAHEINAMLERTPIGPTIASSLAMRTASPAANSSSAGVRTPGVSIEMSRHNNQLVRIESTRNQNVSSAAIDIKRKASKELLRGPQKIPRTTSTKVVVRGPQDYSANITQIGKPQKPERQIIKDHPSDSFFCRLSFMKIANAMDLLRTLVAIDGMDVSTAFNYVFENAGYKATTFKRHRDVYFGADLDIITEWKEKHGGRPWKEFYQLRTIQGLFGGDCRDGWSATREELKKLERAREEERRAAAREKQARLHSLRIHSAYEEGSEENDDDSEEVEEAEQETGQDAEDGGDSAAITSNASDDGLLDVDALLAQPSMVTMKELKGKKSTVAYPAAWKKGAEAQVKQEQLAGPSVAHPRRSGPTEIIDLTIEPIEPIELINLSSDSE